MTPFAKKVYQVVSTIPIGEVRTYKWVAEKSGSPKAARAVGQVLKNNPYPLIIPCHRVVSSGQKIGGYVFGVSKKKLLLGMERNIRRCLANKK
jgi:methylated-DNA-[protein]-cysteine S-methyltransferase